MPSLDRRRMVDSKDRLYSIKPRDRRGDRHVANAGGSGHEGNSLAKQAFLDTDWRENRLLRCQGNQLNGRPVFEARMDDLVYILALENARSVATRVRGRNGSSKAAFYVGAGADGISVPCDSRTSPAT